MVKKIFNKLIRLTHKICVRLNNILAILIDKTDERSINAIAESIGSPSEAYYANTERSKRDLCTGVDSSDNLIKHSFVENQIVSGRCNMRCRLPKRIKYSDGSETTIEIVKHVNDRILHEMHEAREAQRMNEEIGRK